MILVVWLGIINDMRPRHRLKKLDRRKYCGWGKASCSGESLDLILMEGRREPDGTHPFHWGRIDTAVSREWIPRTRRGKEPAHYHIRFQERLHQLHFVSWPPLIVWPTCLTTFAPALANAEHGDIASIRGMLVHTLLADYDTYRLRRSRRYCEKRKLWPLMEEITICVYDIRLTELTLYERHNVW